MSQKNYALPIQMLAKWALEKPDNVYLSQPINRVYVHMTWAEVYDKVLRLAAGLRSLGLRQGDKIAILGKNTAEWFIADFAAQAAGLIPVPIYPTANAKTISYILEHSESQAIILGKLDSIQGAKEALRHSTVTTISQPYETLQCDWTMADLIANNTPISRVYEPQLSEVASYAYTSGSTGNPKGTVLTYANIAYGANSSTDELELTTEDKLISYLPLAHITERVLIEHVSVYHGLQVSFVESLDTFTEDLKNASPSLFISVPRLWMKFQAGVLAKISPVKLSILLKIPVINNIVRNKIKQQLGFQNVKLFGSGTAPIAPDVLKWYHRIGINISEGWGMTELSGLSVTNFPFRKDKIGTIGVPLKGTEIKISDQGEILIKSLGVFKAYYKEPEKTSETLVDGWVHTGDKGEIDDDGYVRITGRVKDVFKTSKGKYCAPVPIESLLITDPYIEQICVMGSGLPQPIAVVNLSEDTTEGVTKEDITKSITSSLLKTNNQLESHVKIDRVIIAKETWTIQNQLLTPTMKIKRTELEQKYASLLTADKGEKVVWEE